MGAPLMRIALQSPQSALLLAVRDHLAATSNPAVIKPLHIRIMAQQDILPPEMMLPSVTITLGGTDTEDRTCGNRAYEVTLAVQVWVSALTTDQAPLVGGPGNIGVCDLAWHILRRLDSLADMYRLDIEGGDWTCDTGSLQSISNPQQGTTSQRDVVVQTINYTYIMDQYGK
jgi:hypothetical protein